MNKDSLTIKGQLINTLVKSYFESNNLPEKLSDYIEGYLNFKVRVSFTVYDDFIHFSIVYQDIDDGNHVLDITVIKKNEVESIKEIEK